MSVFVRRGYPYLVLTLLSLPAVWPLTHSGLPRTNDALTHYYRVVELDTLVRQGVFFPRWAPHLVHNYGYPIFNFFFYLAHYVVEGFHLLGLDFLTAFKAALALILLSSAWFAYRLGRDYFGEVAGLMTGVAYLYSPYLLYDAYIRGSLTESLALALLPLALLALRRAAQTQAARACALAGLAVAACLLAHHGVMLQALPFLGLYSLWESLRHWPPAANRLASLRAALLAPALSFLLALLLTAFFWLPVLTEAQFVQTERGTSLPTLSYSNNFLSWGELIAWPRWPVDPMLLNPPVVRPLPVVGLVLAVIALAYGLAVARCDAEQRATLAFFALAALGGTLLILPLARPIWDVTPVLPLTQFPWRLLGPVSLFIAVLVGSLFAQRFERLKFRPVAFLVPATSLLFIGAGLPFATPPFESPPAQPTLRDVAAFEIPPDFLGTTTNGEYLPHWVRQLPADIESVRQRLINGEKVERFEWRSAITGQVNPTTSRGMSDSFQVTVTAPATFVYKTFYFPGWRATLDGQSAPIQITYPDGLMAVTVPAGIHTLTFRFGTTLPRVIGGLLSGLGLLAMLLLLSPLRFQLGAWHLDLSGARPRAPVGETLTGPALLWLLAFAGAVALARPWLYDAGRTPLLQPRLKGDGLAGVTHPLNQDFASEVTLLGWDAPRESFGADDSETINLYWKANHPLGVAYGFDLRLVDDQGFTWSEPGPPRPRDWRFTPGTDYWPTDQYILDPYVVTPLAGTPPGDYFLLATVFARYNLQPIGTARFGPITLNAPSRRACADASVSAIIPALVLQEAQFSLVQARPGDSITGSICWQATAASSASPAFGASSASVRLLDPDRRLVVERPVTLPTLRDVSWREQFAVQLPATLEAGDYIWQAVAAGQTVTLGALHLTTPQRLFTAPEVTNRLDANLGSVIVYGIEAPTQAVPGSAVSVKLVWQSNALMPVSYRVFLHLTDAEGNLVAQSDGVPTDWTRPTSGWLPGEFVTDTRTLNLPPNLEPGTYRLFAGMYRPETGERLTTPQFPDGRVPVGSITLQPHN